MNLHKWWLIPGIVGFLGYVPGFPTELRLLNLLLLTPWVLGIGRGLFQRRDERTEAIATPPFSPAAGGVLLVTVRMIVAQILMLLIPSMLRQVIQQNRGDAAARPRAIENPEAYQQQAKYRLPFDGTWYVFNGGVTPETSHSWDIVAQRYAYDFVVVDNELRRWRTDGKTLEDYLCYDLPILSPADGEVVAVVDGVRDAPGVGTGWLDVFTSHFPGNAVTIQHAEGEYSFLAHLKPGSICVRVGDRVQRGQEIGRCGNSGHSTEPHLHFQLQDHEDFFKAAGLPIAFDKVIVDGEIIEESVCLTQGIFASQACIMRATP